MCQTDTADVALDDQMHEVLHDQYRNMMPARIVCRRNAMLVKLCAAASGYTPVQQLSAARGRADAPQAGWRRHTELM